MCALVVAAGSGCLGELQQDGPMLAPAAAPDSVEGEAGPDQAFVRSADQLLLQPFRARLNRVAAVAGLATSDAALAPMRSQRLELGDYDFAQGISPDLNWTSQRMGNWIRAVLPVCDSTAFKARYPDWRTSLPAFVMAAHAREVLARDLEEVEAVLADASLPDGIKHRAICVALLSSAEFVTQ